MVIGFLLFLVVGALNSAFMTKPEWEKKGGFYSIKFNKLFFEVDARLSGRITSFQLDGHEFLGTKEMHSENFGSTFWPGPQSNWGWPPYPVLDGQPYSASVSGDVLILESENCEQSGFKFFKKFQADPKHDCIEIEYTIQNISERTIEVDPWEVTRAPSMGLTFFTVGEDSALEKSNLINVINENGMVWYYCDTTLFDKSQKLFIPSTGGWIAHVENEMLFIKVFPDIETGACAQGQAEVEVFAHNEHKYIELETHGEMKTLKPGENLVYPVKWYLKPVPEFVGIQPGNLRLVREVEKNLNQQ